MAFLNCSTSNEEHVHDIFDGKQSNVHNFKNIIIFSNRKDS